MPFCARKKSKLWPQLSKLQLISILILSLLSRKSDCQCESDVLLSPSSSMALVCPDSDLVFTCSTERRFIEWNVTVIDSAGMRISRTRILSDTTQSRALSPLIVIGKQFNLTIRTLVDMPHTLSSELLIFNTSSDLNGTEIRCTDYGNTQEDSSTSLSTLTVIGPEFEYYVDSLHVRGVDMLDDHVVVYLEVEYGVVDDVAVLPQEHRSLQLAIVNGSIELTLLYNTVYDVSMLASCGDSRLSTNTKLVYVNCGRILNQTNKTSSQPTVCDVHHLSTQGTVVGLTCSLGLVLTGPNSTTCMENGKWEPDPSEARCKAVCDTPPLPLNGRVMDNYTSTVEGSTLTITCDRQSRSGSPVTSVCTQLGIWQPNPVDICTQLSSGIISTDAISSSTIISVVSSLSSFVFGSLLFFTVGYLCAYCVHSARREKASSTGQLQDDEAATTAHVQSTQDNVLYEDVQLPKQEEEENLELKDNVAYGPLKSTVDREKA